jgi:hypothetical protein
VRAAAHAISACTRALVDRGQPGVSSTNASRLLCIGVVAGSDVLAGVLGTPEAGQRVKGTTRGMKLTAVNSLRNGVPSLPSYAQRPQRWTADGVATWTFRTPHCTSNVIFASGCPKVDRGQLAASRGQPEGARNQPHRFGTQPVIPRPSLGRSCGPPTRGAGGRAEGRGILPGHKLRFGARPRPIDPARFGAQP